MPDDPATSDLLGFPGVQREQPKAYIKELGLAADNIRIKYPRFFDHDPFELSKRANKVVNKLLKDDDELDRELRGGAFLEKDAKDILCESGYGPLIWGDDDTTGIRWKSVLTKQNLRWGDDKER